LVLSAGALRRWVVVQVTSEFPGEPWSGQERQEIHDALAELDANHVTVSVRERTAAASGRWGGRTS
jgi:hypothetical protein